MSLREIILDTETTGMDPLMGDRMVEVGCVELINLMPTGRTFHHYINPEREIPAEATAVHGITNEQVKDKPTFVEIAADLVEFIGDAKIVAHNASFDQKFINYQLQACGFPAYKNEQVIDTLLMARRMAPGAPASLDALCKRFGIDNSNRTLHGALLDAQLLAEVYLELRGGRQTGLELGEVKAGDVEVMDASQRVMRQPRAHAPKPDELAAHEEYIKGIKDSIWSKMAS